MSKSKLIRLAACLIPAIVIWLLPLSMFGEHFAVTEQRMLAIFIMAALMWILEPVPAWVTSTLSILVMLLTVSTGGIGPLIEGVDAKHIVSYQSLLGSYADPIIILFLGGFVMAEAASASGLDKNMAKIMLKPFGRNPKLLLLGFMLTTAAMSMFVSNTATAAMMITMIAPVLNSLPDYEKGKTALALAIPVGANIGGIGTPIGTPPNAIALKYLNDPAGLNMNISFGQWTAVMAPLMLVIVLASWFVLIKLFPFKNKELKIDMDGGGKVPMERWKYITIAVTIVVTIVLWMTDGITNLQTSVVALIPVTVLAFTGIFTGKDLQKLDWSILWMVAGGFALGTGIIDTGLANDAIKSIPFSSLPAIGVIVTSGLLCWGLSTFISNTAAAAMLMPIMVVVGTDIEHNLTDMGGIIVLLVGVGLSASYAMALPISTPPNGIAYATGKVTTKQMALVGVIVGLFSLAVTYLLLFTAGEKIL